MNNEISNRHFNQPREFNLDGAASEITQGSGFVVLKDLFSKEAIGTVLEEVMKQVSLRKRSMARRSVVSMVTDADRHFINNPGLIFDLLKQDPMFGLMIQHPLILDLSRRILGNNCQLSSYCSNTVFPGTMAQKPHMDYPYYDYLVPDFEHITPTLSLTYCIPLTDFTPQNGSTAFLPSSHLLRKSKVDPASFFSRCVQLEASAGDVIAFSGKLQHAAMDNKSDCCRSALLVQMVPAYVRPFEKLTIDRHIEDTASTELRRLLGMDCQHPSKKI